MLTRITNEQIFLSNQRQVHLVGVLILELLQLLPQPAKAAALHKQLSVAQLLYDELLALWSTVVQAQDELLNRHVTARGAQASSHGEKAAARQGTTLKAPHMK